MIDDSFAYMDTSELGNSGSMARQQRAALAKPTVIVLGTIGHGKSTFLNRLAGKDAFKSKRAV